MNHITTQPLSHPTHKFNPSIFREYDIRGTYELNLFDADAYQIGLNYAATLKNGKVAVGFDGRVSSPALSNALISGLNDGGIDVVNIGLVPTPATYFAAFHLDLDGAIMVTGSHNPPDQNGFKIMLGKNSLHGEGIAALSKSRGKRQEARGKVENLDIKADYIKKITSSLIPNACGLKIGWDPANGAAGEITEIISGGKFAINTKIDGTFPAHHADPTVEKNLEQLKDLVFENNLDVGFAFDGDGDRLGIVDNLGRAIWGDQILAILCKGIADKFAGANIVVDVKTSKAVTDYIASLGLKPVIWKTGHSLIKAKMKELNAPLAGEMSAHIFFEDGYFGFDDGVYAAIRFLEVMQKFGKTSAELLDELPKMVSSPEHKIAVNDDKKFELIEKLKAIVPKPFLDIDGVRKTHDYGWWLVRASNTGGNIICRFEADSKSNFAKIEAEITENLNKIGLKI